MVGGKKALLYSYLQLSMRATGMQSLPADRVAAVSRQQQQRQSGASEEEQDGED